MIITNLIIKYQNLNAILRKQKNFIINEKTFRDRGSGFVEILSYYLIMKKIKFSKLADKIRNEQWSDQRIRALESIFIYRRSDIKNLLKEIKAYRNDMVARNYPFQKISDIITKWEMKLSEQSQDELEAIISTPINSPMSDE